MATLAQDTIRKVRGDAKKQQTQAETDHSNTKTKLEEEIGTWKKQQLDTVAENKEKEIEARKVSRSEKIEASL